MIQIKQNQKRKFLILVVLLKRQITILKSLKQKLKFQMLVVQQHKLHQLQLKIKYLILVVLLRKQIIIQKLMKLERNLLIMIMINILLLQSLILQMLVFLMQDQHQQIQWQKRNFDNTVSSLNNKITVNKTKNGSFENEFKKLKTFDSSYFIGKSLFQEDGTQNYLVFQLLNKYFEVIANTDMFHHGNLKNYLLKLLRHLLRLIIVLLHR